MEESAPDRARAPPLQAAHLGVEVAFERVIQGDDREKLAPAQMSAAPGTILESGKTSANRTMRKRFPRSESPSELLLPIVHSVPDTICSPYPARFIFQYVLPDAFADAPVHRHHRRVHRPRHLLACLLDERTDVVQQTIHGGRGCRRFTARYQFFGTCFPRSFLCHGSMIRSQSIVATLSQQLRPLSMAGAEKLQSYNIINARTGSSIINLRWQSGQQSQLCGQHRHNLTVGKELEKPNYLEGFHRALAGRPADALSTRIPNSKRQKRDDHASMVPVPHPKSAAPSFTSRRSSSPPPCRCTRR